MGSSTAKHTQVGSSDACPAGHAATSIFFNFLGDVKKCPLLVERRWRAPFTSPRGGPWPDRDVKLAEVYEASERKVDAGQNLLSLRAHDSDAKLTSSHARATCDHGGVGDVLTTDPDGLTLGQLVHEGHSACA